MKQIISKNNGIPISISLQPTLEVEDISKQTISDKRRVLTISLLAIAVAICISFIAKFLIYLINLVTNLSFHKSLSLVSSTPATNTLGVWVIIVPVIGGIIVGLMALYGSKAIRGHGIPEAMEQILTNQSKIKPTITYLKPISSAIAIGTGGPFGAEGPIIATGGALGSTFGQLLKITHNERKILLAAGATAGMSAIFGSPIAAIFLAIELLLFEFSPRSIIPVALACITGAAGHHFLFGAGPVFLIQHLIEVPSNTALLCYSILGILIGIFSVLVTKVVYSIEDLFEKLPIHWMWWPAIGGLIVGIIGYYAPHTLGVGYENITNILSGSLPVKIVLSLCILKFASWAIALGSGTSGGTLAPLLTIGGATGALLGSVFIYFYPFCGVVIPLAALIGMSAMFAGASRALLTSIVFALETTGQSNALLPLLASCTAAYFVSFFLMENTIMTEKIARRGVKIPGSYEPDILEKLTVEEVMQDNVILPDNINGIETFSNQNSIAVYIGSSLRAAVEKMAKEDTYILPVISRENKIVGALSYKHVLSAYRHNIDNHEKKRPHISIKAQSLRLMVRGKRGFGILKKGINR